MKKIIISLIGFYLISLIFTAPANYLYEKVKYKTPTAILYNIHGNLWRGKANLSLAESNIGPIEWQFSPSNLLFGKAGWNLRVPQLLSSLNFSLYPWNTQTIQTLQLHGPASGFIDLYPFLEGLQASLDIELSNLNLTDCNPSKGDLVLKNVVIAELDFGTINGQLTCNSDLYSIKFKNTNSEIQLEGVLHLSINRTYKLKTTIKTSDQHTIERLTLLPTQSSGNMSFTFNKTGVF